MSRYETETTTETILVCKSARTELNVVVEHIDPEFYDTCEGIGVDTVVPGLCRLSIVGHGIKDALHDTLCSLVYEKSLL